MRRITNAENNRNIDNAIRRSRVNKGKRAEALKLASEIIAIDLDCDSISAGKGRELSALVRELFGKGA